MANDRLCKQCGAKEEDGVPFHSQGLLCRKCYNTQERQRYQDTKGSRVAYDAQYYQDNKKRRSAQHAEYHQKNKEHINAEDRQQYAQKSKDAPVRLCVDCGNPIQKRARKYCAQCKERHHTEATRLGMQIYRKKKKGEENT
jgi:NMD protein affecting ribosome stability and mRNA decay